MRKLNLLYVIFIALCLPSCYDDLGDYEYHDINTLNVAGIESRYARDKYDTLHIVPLLQGTQYSDTNRFTYEWEIGKGVVATTQELHLVVSQEPGEKKCRYIVKDKNTGVKSYAPFRLNISSATAGNLIVVLSKYQGRAELSYLRLDKPSEWAINYYQGRFGKALGMEPQQLLSCNMETSMAYPVTTLQGRLMTLCDNQVSLFDKSTMEQDTMFPYMTGEIYAGVQTYPPTDVAGYKSQYMQEVVSMWRTDPYSTSGGFQKGTTFTEISGGTLYTAIAATNGTSYAFKPKITSRYEDGYLCPFGYWDDMADNPLGNLGDMGFSKGDFVMFDKKYGRFAFYDGSFMRDVSLKNIPAYPDHEILWGSATNISPNNRSIAILYKGSQTRLLMLETGKDMESIGGKVNTKLLVNEVSGGIIAPSSKFHMTAYTNDLYFTNGNALYRYNMLEMNNKTVPGKSHKVLDLTQFGYDANATITDICVSRSEKTILVGVSRYGTDIEAMGEEAKGDILYFDLDVSNSILNYRENKSAKGVSGIPVDIQIKYQTFWRYGLEQDGKTLRDNI